MSMLNCLLVVVIFETLTFCDGKIPIKHGYRLENARPFVALIISSLEECHKACLARNRCRSFVLQRNFNLCNMSSSDSSDLGQSLIPAPGFAYSEKRSWPVKTLSTICEGQCSIHETCNPSDRTHPCIKTECDEPRLLRDSPSDIRGNMRNIGAKVAYVCKADTKIYNTSVCLPNGTWSGVSLHCPNVCGAQSLPVVTNGYFVRGSPDGATATLQCFNNTIPKPGAGVKATCLNSGSWLADPGTCEPIDCGLPSVQHGSYTLSTPSVTSLGATAKITCNKCYEGDSDIACLNNGTWNMTANQDVCKLIDISDTELATNVAFPKYKISNCGSNRWWHYDGSLGYMYFPVTVKYQCEDGFCHFKLEKQQDGSYKIKNVQMDAYLVDGGDKDPGAYLNGKKVMSEEYKSFWIYRTTSKYHRIVNKATKNYVRVDEDQFVSSKQNKKDAFSLFEFIPA